MQKAEQYLATTPPERRLGETFSRLATTDMVKESMPPALYSRAFKKAGFCIPEYSLYKIQYSA